MERDTVWDNAQLLNQFMTNERISFRANDLMLEMLWAAFPVEYEKAASHGNRQKPKFHSHSFCETHYCTSGTYIYRLVDGREFVMNAGDTILIRENVEHEQYAITEGARKISMAYRLTENQTVFNRADKSCLLDATVIHDSGSLFALFQQINEEFKAQRLGFRDMIGSLLFQITMEYERHISAAPSADAVIQRIDKRVEEIKTFISDNLSSDITTMDVADVLHLSKRQINRIVLKEFGTSCNSLIKQVKHKKAQELLLYSDKSIQDIASELGYSNVYSFSKFFKSQEGMPPALFRRSHYSY